MQPLRAQQQPSLLNIGTIPVALLIQAIQYANERYRDSWTSGKVSEGPTPQQEDAAAGSGLKEELSKCPCTTSVHLWRVSQLTSVTWQLPVLGRRSAQCFLFPALISGRRWDSAWGTARTLGLPATSDL